jgi:flavin reductase (DIM6/NTAB) family NADH-FMN oxidoreductase RutF
MDTNALFKISYGLFLLHVKNGDKDNACVVNTVAQLTSTSPIRISVTVNKQNLTAMMLSKTGEFNVSVLTENTPFSIFERFGLQSGMNAEKFPDTVGFARSENGILYSTEYANAVFSAKVTEKIDLDTHVLFIAELTDAKVLSNAPSMTYAYYFEHVKPKAKPTQKKGYVCKICGYVYEGDPLPADFICPLCKHGAEDFEPLE